MLQRETDVILVASTIITVHIVTKRNLKGT